jgi:hypothetical protein
LTNGETASNNSQASLSLNASTAPFTASCGRLSEIAVSLIVDDGNQADMSVISTMLAKIEDEAFGIHARHPQASERRGRPISKLVVQGGKPQVTLDRLESKGNSPKRESEHSATARCSSDDRSLKSRTV